MLAQLANPNLSREAHYRNLNYYEAKGQPARWMERKWWECSKADYWEALEMLPPLRMGSGHFVMSEFLTGSITSVFFEIAGRYYCTHLDVSDPQEIPKMRRRIIRETARPHS